jgi:uncharacterized membrane protein
MKGVNQMNYFFTGVPAAMIGFGYLLNSDIAIMGMLLMIMTGFFQVVVGIMALAESGFRDVRYSAYLAAVLLFFMLWALTDWQWIIMIPPALAFYLSVLLFIDAKKQKR